MLNHRSAGNKRYKIGQTLIYIDIDNDKEILGVIIGYAPYQNFSYIVQFADDVKDDLFTEDAISIMVEDYKNYVKQQGA